MSLFTLCGVLFVCVCALVLIKENGYTHYALALSCIGLIIGAVVTASSIGQAFSAITSYVSIGGVNTNVEVILKAFGIAFVCETASDTLSELGSERIGKWVELAGKAEILALSLPLLKQLLDRAVSML